MGAALSSDLSFSPLRLALGGWGGTFGACQVLRKTFTPIEADMLGGERVFLPTLVYNTCGAAAKSTAGPCYDKANPRTTNRELVKYMEATRRAFEDRVCLGVSFGSPASPADQCQAWVSLPWLSRVGRSSRA